MQDVYAAKGSKTFWHYELQNGKLKVKVRKELLGRILCNFATLEIKQRHQKFSLRISKESAILLGIVVKLGNCEAAE